MTSDHIHPSSSNQPAPEERTRLEKTSNFQETEKQDPGIVIGRYKLLQEIGEGGMGTVYMAEKQEPVRRKVAVKVMKSGIGSKELTARFEAERQALALMEHENIARALDAGTTDEGQPYFVMELIHGIPLTDYCDQNKLSPRERLQLLLPVCDAIQHAHQKGIIHRDLKPSNILVAQYDGRPVPKVIDFGIAKATGQELTEKTLFTHFGQIMGTLEYMSPEQAELNQLDVDTRSDLYSLGVVLYELLTGSAPISATLTEESGAREILRRIREEEPLRPSLKLSTSRSLPSISAQRKTDPGKLSSLVKGELDWIVMKSLEKDRSRRYQTARDFAADINCYLRGEIVEAGPPSAWYRIQKRVKKHRVAITAGLSLLLCLTLGIVVSTFQAVRAARAERSAAGRMEEAQKQRNIAREALKLQAIALKESEHSRQQAGAIAAFMINAFRSTDPKREGKTITVVEKLDQAVTTLKDAFPNHPLAKAELYAAFGDTYVSLGSLETGIGLHEIALELRVANSTNPRNGIQSSLERLIELTRLSENPAVQEKAKDYRNRLAQLKNRS